MKCSHGTPFESKCPNCVQEALEKELVVPADNLVYRLRKRADIRRQIPTRKSVQEGQRDRIADLLEEAANRICQLESK